MEIIHTDAREERVKYILIVDKIYRGNLLFRLNLWCQWIKSFKKWSNEYTIKVLHYVELGFSLYPKFTWGFKEFCYFPLTPMIQWPRHNFSLQNQCNTKQTSNKNKDKYINQKIITWSNTKFSNLTEHLKNCMTVS